MQSYRTKYTNLNQTSAIGSSECWLAGFFCHQTSSLVFNFVDGLIGSAVANYSIGGPITPAANTPYLFPNVHCRNGLAYVVYSGTGTIEAWTLESY